MDVIPYLARLGVQRADEANLDFLTTLQRQHLTHIPFENLDIRRRVRIVLALERLYEKIVLRQRGGFCYELNGLFCWLLQQLGFAVRMVSAQVRNAQGIYGPEYDHMALLVDLDRTYLVDVGFGRAVRTPLVLPDGSAADIDGAYRIHPLSTTYDSYAIQKQDKAGWTDLYRFTTQAQCLEAFTGMCQYHQTSPNSPFTQRSVCSIATATGRITLTDKHLITTVGQTTRESPLVSAHEYHELLQRYFAIVLS
jgi:N-hydroxyarylamine O-acetyltransferase